MEGLREFIKNLIFILLLATFLELLLPSKKMRGFVQLIMGLFVIAAIINPLADFLKDDYRIEIPAWFTQSLEDMPVLAAEGGEENLGNTLVLEQYKKILINQIEILISPLIGDKETEIKIELDKNDEINDYPQILQVEITIYNHDEKTIMVEPVVIGNEQEKEDISDSELASKIKRQISLFMLIPEEKIIIKEV